MKPSVGVPERDSHTKARGAAVVILGFIVSLIAVVYSFAQSSKLPAADRWLHCVLFAVLSVAVGLDVRSRRLRSAPIDTAGGGKDAPLLADGIETLGGAEQAFKANELALRQLLEGLPCQIAAAEPDGRHSYANRRMLDYCGMTLEDAKGSGWLGIIHPEDRPAVAAEWIRCGKACEPMDVNHRLRRHDGAYRWFNARVEPFLDGHGNIVRWYGVITDIHDARLMEEALRTIRDRLAEASKLATVGELSASIAHEINQPLSAVVSNGDACIRWLNASPPNIERARSTAQIIVRDAKSAADVVRRTRALFKHTDSDRASLDANEVILEVLHLMQGELISKGINVSAELGGEIPAVFADRVHVQQILINLVQNGIDAMDEIRDRPKLLVLRSHIREPRFVTIQVKDSGSGIPDPNTIFEPFFTTKEKGLGVGLSICRSIVEAHAGRLWATADDGGGSTFAFTLPVHERVNP